MIVDDNSPDGTADAAEAIFHGTAHGSVYRRSGPRGLGCAYRDAFARALSQGYERIVQMDADLSHDPIYLPELLKASHEAGLVIGSRYVTNGGVRNWPFRRILLSRWANIYVRLITGLPVADATAGFRCWTSEALESVKITEVSAEGYAFQVTMAYRAYKAGVRIKEVPIIFTDRKRGQSKMSGHVIGESVIMPWNLRFGKN